jgi:hypothetical protein
MDFFRLTFLHMSHLLVGGPFGMVFKHLKDFFDFEDSTNGFIQLHWLCSHAAIGFILRSMVRIFGAS